MYHDPKINKEILYKIFISIVLGLIGFCLNIHPFVFLLPHHEIQFMACLVCPMIISPPKRYDHWAYQTRHITKFNSWRVWYAQWSYLLGGDWDMEYFPPYSVWLLIHYGLKAGGYLLLRFRCLYSGSYGTDGVQKDSETPEIENGIPIYLRFRFDYLIP